jgi:hypothetical protein
MPPLSTASHQRSLTRPRSLRARPKPEPFAEAIQTGVAPSLFSVSTFVPRGSQSTNHRLVAPLRRRPA